MSLPETTYDPQTKIWSGAKKRLYYDFNTSVGKVIHTQMRNYPNNVCQISDIDGRSITNGEALSWGVRLAQYFRDQGLNYKDVIGIVARNTTYVMPVAIGCFFNCTPFHSVNTMVDKDTLTHLYNLTKPKIIFCDGDIYKKVKDATSFYKPKIFTLTDHMEGIESVVDLLAPTLTEQFYTPELLVEGGSQTVCILCSSGTTGKPKAVCMSNYTMFYDASFCVSGDVFYSSSGIDWVTGVYCLLLSTMFSWTRLITNKPFTAEYFVNLVKKYKVKYAFIPPRHIAALLNCDSATDENLSTLQLVGTGGGFIGMPTLARFQKLVKNALIILGYGQTESIGVAYNIETTKNNSAGNLSPGLRVRIVDESGNNLGPNQIGEIYVNNGLPWNGYYNNPEESKKTRDAEGWIHTGDLAYFDKDNLLFVVDRKKDTLKYQGMHYNPADIEKIVIEMPDILDVCVFGIYSEANGDAAGALVVKDPKSELTEKDVEDYVAKRFQVKYKHLNAGVRFVDKLPQNVNGKTLRFEAKTLFQKLKSLS